MDVKFDTVHVALSQCEALVLFELLASLEGRKGKIQLDAAEQEVLWRLEGQLESMLTEILAANYGDSLAVAKRSILSGDERT